MRIPGQRLFQGLFRLSLFITVAASIAAPARAHDGPPFPLQMDQPLGGNLVSVWADPDVGEANFYVIIETPQHGIPAQEPNVTMWVQPRNRRLTRAEYLGQRQIVNGRMQFELRPHFDECDTWDVGFCVSMPGSASAELLTQVDSTPPGLGIWDLAIYGFPFALLGGMWTIALVRRRFARQSQTRVIASQAAPQPADSRKVDYRTSFIAECR